MARERVADGQAKSSSQIHREVIHEQEEANFKATSRWTDSEASEDYELGAPRALRNRSSGSSPHSRGEHCAHQPEFDEIESEGEADDRLLEQLLRQKRRRKSEQNIDAGVTLENQAAVLPAFDLFNYGFTVEEKSTNPKTCKTNHGKVPPPKNFKITPLLCNKTGVIGSSPFPNDCMKSKKLLNFTEKANEVISERNRLPRKQNLQLLTKKLLDDEDDEQLLEEPEGYLDEQIMPRAPGHFTHHS